MKKLICHMTHINNLPSIIDEQGLLSKNNNTLLYQNIANSDVQDKRAKTIVTLSPGRTLHDYVPFYFYGKTPMLFVNKLVQKDIVFLASYTDIIANAGLPFLFTDRHAIIKYANFYNSLHKLKDLDRCFRRRN
jgi:hypothetical protein